MVKRHHLEAGVAAVIAFVITLVVLGRAFDLNGDRSFIWLIPATFVAALVWNWSVTKGAPPEE